MARYPANGLTLAQAEAITAAARAKGRELNLQPLTVVVLDAGGQVKSVQREDGSSLLRPEIALGKAYGALAMGLGGRELARRAQSMQGFMNALSDIAGGRAVPVPGGVLCCDAGRHDPRRGRHQRRRFGAGRGLRGGRHPGCRAAARTPATRSDCRSSRQTGIGPRRSTCSGPARRVEGSKGKPNARHTPSTIAGDDRRRAR